MDGMGGALWILHDHVSAPPPHMCIWESFLCFVKLRPSFLMKYPRKFWKVTTVYIHKQRTSNICWIHSRVTCLCGILLIYIPIHKEGLPFQFCTFGNYFKYYVGLSSGQELPSEEVSKYWTYVFYWQQWQQFSSHIFLLIVELNYAKK